MTERELLTAGLRELGVAECPPAADNLLRYSEILREKNKVMNLTAITEPEQVARLHFLDCIALLGAANFYGKSVIDVGCGAGFPGVPLKIAEPSIARHLHRICRRMDACSMWEREPVFRACRWRFCARRPSLCCSMHCASALIF